MCGGQDWVVFEEWGADGAFEAVVYLARDGNHVVTSWAEQDGCLLASLLFFSQWLRSFDEKLPFGVRQVDAIMLGAIVARASARCVLAERLMQFQLHVRSTAGTLAVAYLMHCDASLLVLPSQEGIVLPALIELYFHYGLLFTS